MITSLGPSSLASHTDDPHGNLISSSIVYANIEHETWKQLIIACESPSSTNTETLCVYVICSILKMKDKRAYVADISKTREIMKVKKIILFFVIVMCYPFVVLCSHLYIFVTSLCPLKALNVWNNLLSLLLLSFLSFFMALIGCC